RACAQRLPVHEHHVVLAHFRAGTGRLAVDADPARGDQAIGLATRTEPGTGDVLVEAGGHAPFSAPGGPAATTRSRPPRLAWYIAASARASSASGPASCGCRVATPMLIVAVSPGRPSRATASGTWARTASIRSIDAAVSTPGSIIRNSSPPMRAASAASRTPADRVCATATSTWSPTEWP